MQKNFKQTVLQTVKNIPKGSVLSYAEVARLSGRPHAYRAVAQFMSANYDISVPCHRVIYSDGTIGNYNRGGSEMKQKLLLKEGYRA